MLAMDVPDLTSVGPGALETSLSQSLDDASVDSPDGEAGAAPIDPHKLLRSLKAGGAEAARSPEGPPKPAAAQHISFATRPARPKGGSGDVRPAVRAS